VVNRAALGGEAQSDAAFFIPVLAFAVIVINPVEEG